MRMVRSITLDINDVITFAKTKTNRIALRHGHFLMTFRKEDIASSGYGNSTKDNSTLTGSNGTAPTPQPSIIETPEPSTETPEPSTETPEPTTEPPQPTTETPEPTTETPEPSIETPTETPEPSIETPTETPEPELSMSGSASEEMGESGSEEAPSSIREPEVISNGNQLESPLASIGKIILNITGSFNITGLLNVTLF